MRKEILSKRGKVLPDIYVEKEIYFFKNCFTMWYSIRNVKYSNKNHIIVKSYTIMIS